MKLSVLQHAENEGPGEIAAWARARGHEVICHYLYRGDPLPAPGAFDLLVVMGGEMNIYQYRDYPWLKPEREFIAATMAAGRPVVGICLGAQLIADVLGARVAQNPLYELGWLPVEPTAEARQLFPSLPASPTVLHWHGDTFDLPAGAIRLAHTPACPEQGYVIPGKCLALQFHFEADPGLVEEMVRGQEYWPSGPYVQTREEILTAKAIYHEENRRILHGMLDTFLAFRA